jgi:addiction module HigA family antidote
MKQVPEKFESSYIYFYTYSILGKTKNNVSQGDCMTKTNVKDPGTVLTSFIREYRTNPTRLAADTGLSQSTVRQLTLNKMKISVPIALRFAKFFGNSPAFWIDLQIRYEMAKAAGDSELSKALKSIKKAKKPAVSKSK